MFDHVYVLEIVASAQASKQHFSPPMVSFNSVSKVEQLSRAKRQKVSHKSECLSQLFFIRLNLGQRLSPFCLVFLLAHKSALVLLMFDQRLCFLHEPVLKHRELILIDLICFVQLASGQINEIKFEGTSRGQLKLRCPLHNTLVDGLVAEARLRAERRSVKCLCFSDFVKILFVDEQKAFGDFALRNVR